MNIAIGYPPLESSKGIPLISQNRQFQWFNEPTYIYPMVPASAATILKEAEHTVLWADGIAKGQTFAQWEEELVLFKTELLCLETKTPVVKPHWRIINTLKKRHPDMTIVLCGDHVTAMPEESFKESSVDIVLTGGNYDFLLKNLCASLSKGNIDTKKLEPGIYYKDGKGTVKNSGTFKLNHDLSSLPFIDRDLTMWHLYSEKNGNYRRLPGTYTMAARDCWWHKCTFCSWTTTYPEYHARKPEQLVAEIEHLHNNYGIKEVMDDSGSFPQGEWLETFCRLYIEAGLHKKVTLDCNMRFGALKPEQYKLMYQAGFRFVLFGLESASNETLKRIQKGLTVDQITESCRSAAKAGLSPHITIMFGYPWETFDDVKNTVELGRMLMKKGWAKTLQATIVIPYPGTPLFKECRENGWLLTEDWDRYDMRECVMKTDLTEDQVKEAVQRVYKVAFHPAFIMNTVLNIREKDDLHFIARGAKKVIGHLMDFGK